MRSKRSPRSARGSGRRTISDRVTPADKERRSAGPRRSTRAVGRIGSDPTAADLQELWLPTKRGQKSRVSLDGPISIESGMVNRGAALRSTADRPGFRWDVPAPDPSRTVLWASLAFDWQFYEWTSLNLPNNTDNNIFVDGSLDWSWYLTGNPFVFPRSWVYMNEAAPFTFNTFIVPGGNGFDVGWLSWPQSTTYSSVPDKTDASMTSPLQRLLAMTSGGALMLWFAMDFQNIRYRLDAGLDITTGYILNGGPTTLYYAYAYSSMASGMVAVERLLEG
jgi:hypothetical protein